MIVNSIVKITPQKTTAPSVALGIRAQAGMRNSRQRMTMIPE